MRAAVFPIFLIDGQDVAAIATASAVRSDLEPFLRDEPVRLLDALARPLQLVVESRRSRRWKVLLVEAREVVGVEVVSDEQDDGFLRETLTRYLRAEGSPVPQEAMIRDFAEAAAQLIR